MNLKDKDIITYGYVKIAAEYNKLLKEINDLKAINEDLQDKLSKIKYLDRDTIQECLLAFWAGYIEVQDLWAEGSIKSSRERIKKEKENLKEFVEYICSLAIPVIDKDKILQIFEKYENEECSIENPYFEQIADEILK